MATVVCVSSNGHPWSGAFGKPEDRLTLHSLTELGYWAWYETPQNLDRFVCGRWADALDDMDPCDNPVARDRLVAWLRGRFNNL